MANIKLKDPITGDALYPITSDSTNGVANMIKNAREVLGAKSTAKAQLIAESTIASGTSMTGVIYSSARYEDTFVPNNVSLWTYLSALSNPNSYLYTVNIHNSPYNISGLAHAFYGQVCSSFVQWALGIKYNFQIYQMHYWDGLEQLYVQDVKEIKVGDILLSLTGTHVKIVIAINSNNTYEIAEGVPTYCTSANYTASQISGWMNNNGYKIFRYKYLDSVKHKESVFDDMTVPYSFNPNIMPRRGDKANWRKDEDVVIDILNQGDYTSYQLYKNDELVSTTAISSSVINLGVLNYGNYKLRLTDGSNYSDYVYWIVVDYADSSEKVSTSEGKSAKLTFSSANAVPVWITWRRPQDVNPSNNMPLWTTPIEYEDLMRGYVVSTPPTHFFTHYSQIGTWEFKVAYETEYGILSGDSTSLAWT